MTTSKEVQSLLGRHFLVLVRDYVREGGKLCTWPDIVAAVVGAAIGVVTTWHVTSFFASSSLINIAQAALLVSGTAFGITIAALAISASLVATHAIRVIRDAGKFPAVFMPYWLIGVSWVWSTIFCFLWYVWEQSTVSATALDYIFASVSLGLLAFSLSLTASLYRSILRMLNLAADADG